MLNSSSEKSFGLCQERVLRFTEEFGLDYLAAISVMLAKFVADGLRWDYMTLSRLNKGENDARLAVLGGSFKVLYTLDAITLKSDLGGGEKRGIYYNKVGVEEEIIYQRHSENTEGNCQEKQLFG